MRHCSKTFFDFLIEELKTPVDEVDYLGRNPFMLNAIANPNKTEVTPSVQRLLDMNVKFDLSDAKGRTPFLIYYENSNLVLANKLLEQGANIKQMDSQGLFALKFALIRRNNAEI
jgi:ankyrin repeat protein